MIKRITTPSRLLLMFILAVLAATLGIIFYLGLHLKNSAYNDAVLQQRIRAQAIAEHIDREIDEMQKSIEFLAKIPIFTDISSKKSIDRSINGIPEQADAGKRQLIRDFLRKRPHFTVITNALPNGDHFFAEPFHMQKNAKQFNIFNRPYIQEILRTKKTVITDSFAGADGKPVIVIATPVLDNKNNIKVIKIGVFYLEALSYLVDKSRIGSGKNCFVIDRKHQLVTTSERGLLTGKIIDLSKHPLVKKHAAQSRGNTSTSDGLTTETYLSPLTGERVVGTYVPLSTGWGLVLSSNLKELYAPIYEDLFHAVIFLIIVMSFLGWMGFTIIGRSVNKVQTAEQVALTEKNFSDNILNTLPGVFFLFDEHLRITRWNKNAESVTGYTAEEIKGMSLLDFFVTERKRDIAESVQEAFTKGYSSAEAGLLTKQGSMIPYHFSGFPFTSEHKNYVVEIGLDISERKKLQEQLLQAQKMESVGHLAGGIAHDFNNLLTAILGYGSLVQNNLKADDPTQMYVAQILASGNKAADLTKSLLAFSRKQIISPEPHDVNDIVKGIDKILRRVIGEDIELKTVLSDKSLTVLVDKGQIDQVIMNFATNARDAMPEGGLLSIETGLFQADAEYATMHLFEKPGMYASIAVTDTGMGMDERTKERIFEPFFTTKEMGRGTGLGLAIVYGIVKQHNGYINVYSEPGKGTTFKIYLPLTQKSVAGEVKKALPPQGGTETVLVAEDESAVRLLLKMVLEGKGYNVIEAENGEEAVSVFQEHKDAIGLLLFDVIMPKKNGKQAYEEIKNISPDTKVIFMSGYADNIFQMKDMIEKESRLIAKPIEPDTLLRVLREVLDR